MNTPTLNEKLGGVTLIAFDVDGVFTDGRFYLSDDGVETKAFNTQDGYGVRRLLEAGIEVAVISGRRSAAVERRMAELGVRHVFLGCADKVAVFGELLSNLGITAGASAYVGDDLPDMPVLREAGVAIAVANAHDDVRKFCDWTTGATGGNGAVREVCDAVLHARNSGPADDGLHSPSADRP